MTRREFISKSSSSYMALVGLGLIPQAPATPFELQKNFKSSKKILILGAGLAGMTAAYELGKLGYDCTILEARNRAGGRIWTVRKGTEETEVGGEKQVCNFDNGLYLNGGAARIPHHHQISMHYCRELKVPLELFGNFNEGGFFYSESTGKLANQSVHTREIHADMRGYTCELLAKALDKESLDESLTKDDVEKLIEFLKAEGDLDSNKKYNGSERRGYKNRPGYGTKNGEISEKYNLKDIIESGFFHLAFANVGEYTYHQQPTMLQPVGGMESLSKALEKQVSQKIIFQAEVKEIRKMTAGVKVSYIKNGTTQEVKADFCICTIPLPVLRKVQNDFSPDIQRAIDFVPYMSTGKIGLQFKRRFWEEDESIFGGITKTNMDITQIFYPSYGFLGEKGVLKGYYNFHDRAVKMGDLSLADRQKAALEQGGKIHPQYKTEFETAFSLAWHKIPFSMGGWADYSKAARQKYYPALIKPDGDIYFAGEHTTYLTAWMAGAFTSARAVVEQLHTRISKEG
jgi:monoamine oxidase